MEIYESAFHSEALKGRRFYNIGAGAFRHPYWVNVDYENDWYKADSENTRMGIQHDLFSSTPIPIKDGSGELAYTSHTIEHLTDDVALRLFSEVYRFLKPGGYFRIVAPDAILAFRAYLRGDRDFFTWIEDYSDPERMKAMSLAGKHSEASLEQILIYHICSAVSELHADSPCQKVSDSEFRELVKTRDFNSIMDFLVAKTSIDVQRKYVGNHCNWWTHEKTAAFLRRAGFECVNSSAYLQSDVAALRNPDFFDGTVPSVSFFSECRKHVNTV